MIIEQQQIQLKDYIIKYSSNGWFIKVMTMRSNNKIIMFIKNIYNKISAYLSSVDIKQILIKNNMQEGTVKFFNETKGFGFISNGNEDIFVHVSGLRNDIRQNDQVIFDIEKGNKGLNAVNVRLANNNF